MRASALLIPFLALLTACDDPAGPGLAGRLTGRLGPEAWVGPAVIAPGADDGPTIFSTISSASGTRTLAVELRHGTQPGTYSLGAGEAWYVANPRDGDAYSATAVSGTLVITEADATGLRGTLELAFETPGRIPLLFQDGEVHAVTAIID
jgi:hypothetical protein